jgi:hypothetical protein
VAAALSRDVLIAGFTLSVLMVMRVEARFPLRVCHRECNREIHVQCGVPNHREYRRCKRDMIASCRQLGPAAACSPPTTTTTTTITTTTASIGTVTTTSTIPDGPPGPPGSGHIQTVFIILMENHNWSSINSSAAPYINGTLLPMGAHAKQFFNPPHLHPSLPNYLWLEGGTNFGVHGDGPPSSNHQSSTAHLATLLTEAEISWKGYMESMPSGSCPRADSGKYAVRHDPFVYFDDVTTPAGNCVAHVRPYSEFAGDLAANTVARYNFITPNVCNDMHDCSVRTGDTWLSHEVPHILASQAYLNDGAIFLTWDEAGSGDGPIGMVVLSPLGKGGGYSNSIHYTHSSTLRTVQEIFGVTPLLGDAANATDLSDLFTTFP